MTALIMTADTIGLKSLASLFRTWNAKRVQNARIRTTIKELSALSDKELWDIGICRGEIYSVAHSEFDAKENDNLKGWV